MTGSGKTGNPGSRKGRSFGKVKIISVKEVLSDELVDDKLKLESRI